MIGIDGMIRCHDENGKIIIGNEKDIINILGAVPPDADGAVLRTRGGYIFEGDYVEWDVPTMRGNTIIKVEKLHGIAKLKKVKGRKAPEPIIDLGDSCDIPAWHVNVSLCKVKARLKK